MAKTSIETTREERLAWLLYRAIVELEFVQCVENCERGLCATGEGKSIVEDGMKALGVQDLSIEGAGAFVEYFRYRKDVEHEAFPEAHRADV